MLELYQAYADYRDLMDMVERMFQGIADMVCGTRKVEYQGETFDFGSAFRRVTVEDLVVHFTPGIDRTRLRDVEYLRGECAKLHIPVKPDDGAGKLQIEIFEKTAEHRLLQPTFVYAYPAEVRRSHAATIPIRSLRTVLNSSSAAARSRMGSRNSTTRKTRRRGSASRWRARAAVTKRRCSTMPTMSVRWNTACRRRPGSASASIAW